MLKSVEGIEKNVNLDTLYMKRNRLGVEKNDVECLKALLGNPALTCVDLSNNYLSDPAILDEILVKMPKLGVLYL